MSLSAIRAFVFDVDGVLSPSTIAMGDDGVPMRMANIKDGYALQLARKLGYPIAIITGANTENIRRRYNTLGIKDVYLSAANKLPLLEEWLAKNGLAPEEVVYMGDDIPDLPAMKFVGYPCAPADAAVECREAAAYVSPFEGGRGCVRDIIEQVLRARDEWLHEAHAFGW